MSRLKFSASMSLDGYSAGPDQSRDNPLGVGGRGLHEWAFATRTFHAMQGQELLSVELEVDGHDRSGGTRAGVAVARDVQDLRVREDRRIERRRVLAFRVEPEAGCDLTHRSSFPVVVFVE